MLRRRFLFGGMATFGAASAPVRNNGVLRLAASPLGHDIDPYHDAQSGIDELAWLYADGLVGGKNGDVPLLAEALPKAAHDGRSYRYRLRNATWHDGRPVTPRDVASAFAEVRASAWGTYEPYRFVRDIVAAGEREFDVRLTEPWAGFPRTFFGAYGSPALPVIRHDGSALPIGTGPFAVRAHAELGRWTLKAWRGSPRGTSTIGAIDLRVLSSDITATVQLLSGEADIALPLPPNASGMGGFRRVTRFTSTAVLLINARGALGTAAVRHAFAAVANVPALQRAYDPRRKTLFATLFLTGPDDPPLASRLAYRPEAADALRAAIGQRDLILAYVAGSPSHERTMTLLQQTLRAARVASTLRPYSAAIYRGLEGPLRSGRFDVAMDGFIYGEDRDLGSDWSCLNSSPAPGNMGRWCDAAYDAAVARRDPRAARRRLYDELPCIPLSRAYENVGIGSRVGGFKAQPTLVPATYGCADWTPSSAGADRR